MRKTKVFYKGFKFRIYPTKEQAILIMRNIHGARFAYNWAINRRKEMEAEGQRFQSGKNQLRNEFTQMKKQYDWLIDRNLSPSSRGLRNAIEDANQTYDKYGKKSQFRKRKNQRHNTYKDEINGTKYFYVGISGFQLSKVGWVKARVNTHDFIGKKLKNIRINFDGLHFWVSFAAQVDNQEVTVKKGTEKTGAIGIDVGLNTFAVCSNGRSKKSPSWKKEEQRLKVLQRRVDKHYKRRKELNKMLPKGEKIPKSKNLKKLEVRILKLRRKITNRQTDFIHQFTTDLVQLNPTQIVIEDIKFSDWGTDKHQRDKVRKSKFYEWRRQLEYKCKWNGIELIIADKWFPSTQKCSHCGHVKVGCEKLQQKDRIYRCNNCGTEKCRDFNASLNLKTYPNRFGKVKPVSA